MKIKKIEILLLNQILHYPLIKYDAESQNMAKKMKKINYAHKLSANLGKKGDSPLQ